MKMNQQRRQMVSTPGGGDFPERLANLSAEELDRKARGLAEQLARKESLDTQIRRIMGAVRRTEVHLDSVGEPSDEMVQNAAMRLRPRIAYAAGRKSELRDLQAMLDGAIPKVKNIHDFKRFVDLVEAIVGYYTYFAK